ncbi:MAG: hypothetical protein AAF583_08955 [Pseudomonadota bacterium]
MQSSAEIEVSIGAVGPLRECFDEPRLKLKQAERHLNRLRVLEEDHLNTDWFDHQFEPATSESIARLTVIVQLPGPEYSGVMGDIIHNCRAALDILACLMVRLNNRSDKGVYFPFAKSAIELDKAITSKKFDRASDSAQRVLRELRPYVGGNVLLRAIHDLDIHDKHRALVPSHGSVATPKIKCDMLDGRAEIVSVEYSKPTMRLVFPNRGPLGGQEIIPSLDSMIAIVRTVILAFEALNEQSGATEGGL